MGIYLVWSGMLKEGLSWVVVRTASTPVVHYLHSACRFQLMPTRLGRTIGQSYLRPWLVLHLVLK